MNCISRVSAGRRALLYAVALVIGAAVRIAGFPSVVGTNGTIEGWSYVAATRGAPRLYDWAASPRDPGLRRVDGFDARGDYPPLALYEFGLVGRVYRRASGGDFSNTDRLTAAVKIPALLAEAALAVLLFLVVGRTLGTRAARRVTLFFWLNPAMILATSVFGDVDALFVLPAVGALMAGAAGWPALAGGLMAAAVLTKPQAVFVAPAVALAIWNAGPPNRTSGMSSALGGAALTSLVILIPIVVAGATTNMILALGTLTLGKDMLSNTGNLWWILGHILHAMQTPGTDVRTALAMPAAIVPISALTDFAPPTARIVVRLLGSALPLAAIAWGVWTARRARDLWLLAAAGAFFVHAYVVLATQVHENHLFGAVPLLALAAVGRARFFALLVGISAIFTLNLDLFYGLGEGGYVLPPTVAGVDSSLGLAVVNCAALAWHARVLRRECRSAGRDTPPGAPVPAGTRI